MACHVGLPNLLCNPYDLLWSWFRLFTGVRPYGIWTWNPDLISCSA